MFRSLCNRKSAELPRTAACPAAYNGTGVVFAVPFPAARRCGTDRQKGRNMKKPVFTGSATALVTPFTDRGVDYDRLAAAIDRQAEGGTAAIVVCGTTGETSTLSEAERASLIEFSVV